MNRCNDTDRRNSRSGDDPPTTSNRNDRRELIISPRSLLRDRPLAEPRRHRHIPLVTMNRDRTQQHIPSVTAAATTANTSNESTTSQPNLDTPPPPPGSEIMSPLPSIDEGSSHFYRKRMSNSRNQSGSPLASQVPSLSAASDSSSYESNLELSTHSIDSSGSDSTMVDYEYENLDDNDISVSMRSTQSMPPALTTFSRKSTPTRRRPDLPKRSKKSFPSSQRKAEPFSVRRMQIPPPPFARQSRRQSYPPITQSYLPSTKTKASPSTEFRSKISKNRRIRLRNFLLSGLCMQLLLLVLIALLVAWSRSQAAFASDTLLRLEASKSMSLLKLHRLESHSMHVHELMRNRLLRKNGKNKDTDHLEDLLDGEYPEEVIDPEDDPLMNQYQQLSQMSLDLRKHADVATLQSTLQETAIDEIISTYGEGPVKVVVELDFGDKAFIAHEKRQSRHTRDMIKGTYISIILWPDTPHAAWVWLEQIRRSVWDGSFVELNPTSTFLQFQSIKDDPMDRGHLEFVESHPSQEKSNPDMNHGAWTIGLRETIGDDKKGRLEMFINLADNQEERKHETCIGKIFDGFDALQRLLEGTDVTPYGDANTNVTVKSMSAMHLTHKELQQIYR